MKEIRTIFRLTFLIVLLTVMSSFGVVYVDKNAAGANDGTSWTDAYNNLRSALEASTGEFWVADGTYTPGASSSTSFRVTIGDYFIYGGFAGNETARSQRDWTNNLTVLSGDLGGGIYALNIVTKQSPGLVILDGFTVKDGRAVATYGAGVSNAAGKMVIQNCIFTNLFANTLGGAIYSAGTGIALTNSTFIQCYVTNGSGGAVYFTGAGFNDFNSCLFKSNWAQTPAANWGGGAVVLAGTYNTNSFSNCVFISNYTTNETAGNAYGGAIFVEQASSRSVLMNCAFTNCYTKYAGGACYMAGNYAGITNCSFFGCYTTNAGFGGALDLINAGMKSVSNCTFVSNFVSIPAANWGGGAVTIRSTYNTNIFRDCTFTANYVTNDGAIVSYGGAIYVEQASSPFATIGCTYLTNYARYGGGALQISSYFAGFTNCTFAGNCATNGGLAGAVYAANAGLKSFSNCVFVSNYVKNPVANYGGGAVSIISNYDTNEFMNCVFVGNCTSNDTVATVYGGAIQVETATANSTLTDCVFTNNYTKNIGGACSLIGYYISMTNCTFFGNYTTNGGCGGAVYLGNAGLKSVSNCVFVSNYVINPGNNYGGGAVYLISNYNTNEFRNCVFSGNYTTNEANATIYGGAIYSIYNDGTIRSVLIDCCFSNNYTKYGGGAFYSVGAFVSMTNCTFFNNYTTNGGVGGAVEVLTAGLKSFSNCVFVSNWVAKPTDTLGGGAVWIGGAYDTNEFRNCVFSGNYTTNEVAAGYGGAIRVETATADSTLTDCVFTNNHTKTYGGACDITASFMSMTNCTFVGNYTTNAGMGGALYTESSGFKSFSNCVFVSNYLSLPLNNWGGGAVTIRTDYDTNVFRNCVFNGNYTTNEAANDSYGGALFIESANSVSALIDCAFTNNFAKGRGGACWLSASYSGLTNCTFTGNFTTNAGLGGAIHAQSAGLKSFSNCVFVGNYLSLPTAGYGGGAVIIRTDYDTNVFRNCVFSGNYTTNETGINAYGGAVYVENANSASVMSDCVFSNNFTKTYGGAVYVSGQASYQTVDFVNNSVTNGSGGAVSKMNAHQNTFIGCSFVTNRAYVNGGGVYFDNTAGTDTFVNCTFLTNTADTGWGGAIRTYNGSTILNITNSIFWGNLATVAGNSGSNIYNAGTLNMAYSIADSSLISGGTKNYGMGVINSDPLFASQVMPFDIHEQSQYGRWTSSGWIYTDGVTSPCIDIGDPISDLLLEPQPNGGRINAGRYGNTAQASKSANGGSVVVDSAATNVSTSSATLAGNLLMTNDSPTAIYIYYGETDAFSNKASWGFFTTNGLDVSLGAFNSTVAVAANKSYYWRCYASNATTSAWAQISNVFITGEVTLQATDNGASETGDKGSFVISRPSGTEGVPLTIYYQVSGSASNGNDYSVIASNVVINAGAVSTTIIITALADWDRYEPDETVTLTLTAGNYPIGAQSNDTVTITNNPLNNLYYVNGGVGSEGDGASWATAFKTLSNALARATGEFWVASGTYTPGTAATNTFYIRTNYLYGGFAATETTRSQRDWTNNLTTLSGDLGGGVYAKNIITKQVAGFAVLDGFTLRDAQGVATYGPGVSNALGTMAIQNCIFTNLYTADVGGAIYTAGTGIGVTNCSFIKCYVTAGRGGAIYCNAAGYNSFNSCLFKSNWAQSPQNGWGGGAILVTVAGDTNVFSNCVFISCYTTNETQADIRGGAIYVDNAASPSVFMNCAFTNCYTKYAGGALCLIGNRVGITNCTFVGCNTTNGGYGGAVSFWSAGLRSFSNCVFVSNYVSVPASSWGGTVTIRDGSASNEFLNCVFSGNYTTNEAAADTRAGAIYIEYASSPVAILNSSFTNCYAKYIGGACYLPSYFVGVTNCTFVGCGTTNGGYGGALSLHSAGFKSIIGSVFVSNYVSKPVNTFGGAAVTMRDAFDSNEIRNCVFVGNYTTNDTVGDTRGGAVHVEYASSPSALTDCVFTNNRTRIHGGACFLAGYYVGITNCTFAENWCSNFTGSGGAIFKQNAAGVFTLNNCTFTSNRNCNGGAIYSEASYVGATNCTFIGNYTTNSSSGGGAIYAISAGMKSFSNCVFISNYVNVPAANLGGGAVIIRNDYNVNEFRSCVFSGNFTTNEGANNAYGGAIYIENGNSASTLSDCVFTNNFTKWVGGAIYTPAQLSLTACDFVGNQSTNGSGGAIWKTTAHTNVFRNCSFVTNWAKVDGGGVYFDNQTGTNSFLNCTFYTNTAFTGYGGAIRTVNAGTMLNVSNCVFWNDWSALSGSNIYNAGILNLGYSIIDTNRILVGTRNYGSGLINTNPIFASAVPPYDMHEQSGGGRWTAGGWVNDPLTSPCLDIGNPADDYSVEPMPNGDRVNIGRYGNTVQASKSWFTVGGTVSITTTSATFVATLVGSNANCILLYDTNNWGATLANWQFTNSLGNLSSGAAISNAVAGLLTNTVYYWRLYATNNSLNIWGYSEQVPFTTICSPVVDNDGGATGIFAGCAALRCTVVTSHFANVTIYYGTNDGGTTIGSWQNAANIGVVTDTGVYTQTVWSLISGTTYYYRCYATNAFGDSWAPTTTNFNTLGTIFVDTNLVGGANNGTTWANAYKDLALALTNASSNAVIWVAQGTYTNVVAWSITTNGISLYGGFTNSSPWENRNWTNNQVIIDAKSAHRGFEVYTNDVTIDGVTIKNGGGTTTGLGTYFTGHRGMVRHCIVTNCGGTWDGSYGGGIYFGGVDNQITDTKIMNNVACNGRWGCKAGGVYALGTTIIRDSTIMNNWNSGNGDQGGGIYFNSATGTLTLTNCLIRNNTGYFYGGGVFMAAGTLNAIDCNFVSNSAYNGIGGAVYFDSGDTRNALFKNCAFVGNNGYYYGGAIYQGRASTAYTVTVENCSFFTNFALQGSSYGGAIYMCAMPLKIRNSIFYKDNSVNLQGRSVYSSGSVDYAYSCFTETNELNIYVIGTKTESNNMVADPLFASLLDLHLKSSAGRWNPDVTNWVTDTDYSPCIDAGDPSYSYTNEPAPNGGRINMGAYGNTVYASKSAVITPPVAEDRSNSVYYTSFMLRGMMSSGKSGLLTIYYGDNDGGTNAANWDYAYTVSAGEGQEVAIPVTRMNPLTTYFYRTYVTNSAGCDWSDASGASPSLFTDVAPPAGGSNVVHVNIAATNLFYNDGSSWPFALLSMQMGIDRLNDITNELWAAGSVKYPIVSPLTFSSTNVAMYGGFNGTETNRNDRNIPANPSVIDCQYILRCIYVDKNDITIDGFIVQGGRNVSHAPGIYVTGQRFKVYNSLIRDNAPWWDGNYGGGLYLGGSGNEITNCIIRDNNASSGRWGCRGGALAAFGTTTIRDSLIVNNFNSGNGDLAGAIYFNSSTGIFTITNTTFYANSGYSYGGAIYLDAGNLYIYDSLFATNYASGNGGAIAINGGKLYATRCTFSTNYSPGNGGAVAFLSSGSYGEFKNCYFDRNCVTNVGAMGGAINHDRTVDDTLLKVINCTFYTNRANGGGGGAIATKNIPLTIANSIFWCNNGGSANGTEVRATNTLDMTYSLITNITDTYVYSVAGKTVSDCMINTDPLFVSTNSDPLIVMTNGYDLHLLSKAGHWTVTNWVYDLISSPCIDAGNPAYSYTNEPSPNGGRINMGGCGNTLQASKTYTAVVGAPAADNYPPVPTYGGVLLRGIATLTNGAPTYATIYFGTNDGSTTASSWNTNFYIGLVDELMPFSTNISGLIYGKRYYCRVNVTNSSGGGWAPATTNFITMNPGMNVAGGLKLWLRADVGTSTNADNGLTYWVDYSGCDNHATGSPPALVANQLNGRPIANFDGTNAYMVVGVETNFDFTNSMSVFAVSRIGTYTAAWMPPIISKNGEASGWQLRRNNTADNMSYTLLGTAGADNTAGTRAVNGIWHLFGAALGNNTRILDIDGTNDIRVTGDTGSITVNNDNCVLGAREYLGFIGNKAPLDIAEILVFNRALTADETNHVSGYLAWKWNLDTAFGKAYRGNNEIINLAATNITGTSAVLNATLYATGSVYDVRVFWNKFNAYTNLALWTNSAYVGSFTNVVQANLSYKLGGIAEDSTRYYYTFVASNAAGNHSAATSATFQVWGAPLITNLTGQAFNAAREVVRGRMTRGGGGDVKVYVGTTDGGTTPANWDTNYSFGTVVQGDEYATNVGVFTYGESKYYYRFYITNYYGDSWATETTNFYTQPAVWTNGLRGSIFLNTLDLDAPLDLDDSSYDMSADRAFTGSKDGTVLKMSEDYTRNCYVTNMTGFLAFPGGSPGDHFATAMSGQIIPRFTGTYWFRWNNDDRGQIYIDLDDDGIFTDSEGITTNPVGQASNSVSLVAGNPYSIILLGQDYTGGDSLNFYIGEPGLAETTVNGVNQTNTWKSPVSYSRVGIRNRTATEVTPTSGVIRAILYSTSSVFSVYAYWGSTNGFKTPSAWENSLYLGCWTNINETNLSYKVGGLTGNKRCYYNFCATNLMTNWWSVTSTNFMTDGAVAINNDGGAAVAGSVAILRGTLTTGGQANVFIYWGDVDKGDTNTAWANSISVGLVNENTTFSNSISSLGAGMTYYYRCYATNSAGTAWAETSTNFTTPGPIYVDTNVVGGANNGSSWANAYKSLAIACTNAASNSIIWVAQGTYTNLGTYNLAITSNGVAVYGGFANGDTWAQRDWTNKPTVIDNKNIRYFRCLTVTTNDVIVDGITFSQGRWYPVYVSGHRFTFRNCKVVYCNETQDDNETGGGLCLLGAGNLVDNCLFATNRAARYTGYGGALYAAGSTIIKNSSFLTNNTGSGAAGGALYFNAATGTLTVSNCIFRSNYANSRGGAIFVAAGSLNVYDSSFVSNICPVLGGGAIMMDSGDSRSLYIRNSSFASNYSTQAGGAIFDARNSSAYDVTIENCSFSSNSTDQLFGGIICVTNKRLVLKNSIVWDKVLASGDGREVIAGSNAVITYTAFASTNPAYVYVGGTKSFTNIYKVVDPLFASTIDLHLKSSTGRWDTATSSWVTDTVDSPCIDMGDPLSSYANEPSPNGGRIDLGSYGNTVQASKSTNYAPTVANSTNTVQDTSAIIRGNLTAGRTALVTLFYGTVDKGQTFNWTNSRTELATNLQQISVILSGLLPNTQYYYITYASNSVGSAWGASSATFTTGPAGTGGGNSIIHVYSNSVSAIKDGTSWSTAYTNLQEGIDAAVGNLNEIWVSTGTYVNAAQFGITRKPNMKIYGGFAATETALSQRNPAQYLTRVDGRAVTQILSIVESTNVTLDGLTFSRSANVQYGGAIYTTNNINLYNCTFTNNVMSGSPSFGIVYLAGNGEITNCLFIGNKISSGGGDGCGGAGFYGAGNITVRGSSFINNQCMDWKGKGGAIYFLGSGKTLTLTNCLFRGNFISSDDTGNDKGRGAAILINAGNLNAIMCNFVTNTAKNLGSGNNNGGAVGAICSFTAANIITLKNCAFAGNFSDKYLKGGAINVASNITLLNCSFYTNVHSNADGTTGGGGAVYAAGSIFATNCIFWQNGGGTNVGNQLMASGQVTVTYSCINSADPVDILAPTVNIGSGMLYVDPLFVSDTDLHEKSNGGGHWTSSGWSIDGVMSPCIDAGMPYDSSKPESFYINEPASSGGRINMGAYGNTVQASRSLEINTGTMIIVE